MTNTSLTENIEESVSALDTSHVSNETIPDLVVLKMPIDDTNRSKAPTVNKHRIQSDKKLITRNTPENQISICNSIDNSAHYMNNNVAEKHDNLSDCVEEDHVSFLNNTVVRDYIINDISGQAGRNIILSTLCTRL